jgi:hypothetical protein
VPLVRFGPVLRNRRVLVLAVRTHMGGHANALMEYLDGSVSGADIHLLLRQFIRNAVPVPVELDMVIDVHTRLLPVPILERLNRKGPQRRTLQLIEERLSRAFPSAERPLV